MFVKSKKTTSGLDAWAQNIYQVGIQLRNTTQTLSATILKMIWKSLILTIIPKVCDQEFSFKHMVKWGRMLESLIILIREWASESVSQWPFRYYFIWADCYKMGSKMEHLQAGYGLSGFS